MAMVRCGTAPWLGSVLWRVMPPTCLPPGFTWSTMVPELLVSDLDASLRFWALS